MTEDTDANALFQSIVETFSSHQDVSIGKMLKAEALQVGGKSFAYPTEDAIVFKLPKSTVDELQDEGLAVRLVVGKREMKEWVVVSASEEDICKRLAEQSYQFVGKV
ncbi:hypothetical protein SLH49_00625 [Cognatiyoonia sp. IB215446]|uniref:hypothetical protein n=1 Tax=Cognatiyoonia sp. IB215446 TaxID=3097355 RepID=UPI002A0E28F0|nr:hypothetical protein [Cognatiyoonia sp. IB215446]MDX8346479.1 hypothetical protein [Cognatiyoonia sp. IB215446]